MAEDLSTNYLIGKNDIEDIKKEDLRYAEAVERAKQRLSEIAVEPSREIMEEKDYITQKFENELREVGRDFTIPPVYFVPRENIDEFRKIYAEELDGDLGNAWGVGNEDFAVVVYDEDVLAVDVAATVYHELSHSIGYQIRAKYKDERFRYFQSGGAINSLSDNYILGDFFEEAYIRYDTEKYINERLSLSMPESYNLKKKIMERTKYDNGLKQTYFQESIAFLISREGNQGRYKGILSGHDLADAIYAYRVLEEQNPEIIELIKKARLTGDWGDASKALNSKFGKGAFKTLMEVTEDRYHAALSLINGALDVDSARERLHSVQKD